jgi:hemoglobin
MTFVSRARVLMGAAALLLATACNSDCCPRRTCCPAPCPPAPCCPPPCEPKPCCPPPCAAPTTTATPTAAAEMPMPVPTPAVQPTPATAPVAAEAPAKKSLFDRLGGLPAISAVTDDFLARILKNETILKNAAVAEHLQKVDAAKLRQLIIEQICEGTGGPCKYSGRDMKTTHTGLNITDAEWDATAADFVASLDKFNVPKAEKDELLAIIVPLKADIVGK